MDDDIIRMAREAGLMAWNGDCVLTDGQLERFFLLAAAAGAAAERERIKAGPVEEQSIVEKFNAAFSRHAATRGDAVLIERRDGRLYMNDSEIGPGTLEIREDGVTYRSAALVDVRKPEQAEPVEPVQEPVALKHRHEWFRTGGMEPGQFRCIHCGVWGQEQADPQIADHLARHGIQACLYPNCVGGQSGTVCHKHCPTPCPDCRGLGYDASGQLCRCQQNPSF